MSTDRNLTEIKKKIRSELRIPNPDSNKTVIIRTYEDRTKEKIETNPLSWLKGGGVSATSSSTSEKITNRKKDDDEEKN